MLTSSGLSEQTLGNLTEDMLTSVPCSITRLRRNRKWIITFLIAAFFLIVITMMFRVNNLEGSDRMTLTIHTAMMGTENQHIVYNEIKEENLWARDCKGVINVINKCVLFLRNGAVDGTFIDAKRSGEEELEKVIGQLEEDEFVKIRKGFIQIPCTDQETTQIKSRLARNHLTDTIDNVKSNQHVLGVVHDSLETFTVIFERRDYANLYWTIIEIYNVFLTARMFNIYPRQISVLLLDVHPRGKLDGLWDMIFGRILRVNQIRNQQWNFKNLAFGIGTYDGPITLGMDYLPFLYDFQIAFYRANGLHTDAPQFRIYNTDKYQFNITLVLRRDYVAHARNPTGKIKRKLRNEREIISSINTKIPDVRLSVIQFDNFSLKDQLKIMYHTDILIGVHGAGLGYVLMMRPHTGLIELFPTSYRIFSNNHFEQFANWAGVEYTSWFNTDIFFKDSEWLYISPDVIVNLIRNMVTKLHRSRIQSKLKHQIAISTF